MIQYGFLPLIAADSEYLMSPVLCNTKFHCINNNFLLTVLNCPSMEKAVKNRSTFTSFMPLPVFLPPWNIFSGMQSPNQHSPPLVEVFPPAVTFSVPVAASQTRFGIQVFHRMMRLSCSTLRESSQLCFLTEEGILWQSRNLSLSSQLAP